MMIPEAWENHTEMTPARRAFYEFHSALMEPWDGPACVVFTDGTQIGAVLDRNGLRPVALLGHRRRPGRARLRGRRARPRPGVGRPQGPAAARAGCSSSTSTERRIVEDDEIKDGLAAEAPYDEWLHAGLIRLDQLPDPAAHRAHARARSTRRQQIFGYTEEELRILLAPMARAGAEPIGSMGTDTPDRRAVGAAAAAVRLLQPAVRPGDQPAARRDPRGAGHLAGRHRSARRATCSSRARRRAARSCCRSR